MTSRPVVGGLVVKGEAERIRRTRSALDEQSGDPIIRTREGRAPQRRREGDVMADKVVRAVVPVLYDVDEAAEALRLSRSLLYELVRSGRLRTVKAGRRRLVPVAALDEYVASLDGVA